ncbi:MAG: hypothetical protein WCF59_02795 [Desulfobaccales bacterium]|jgi:hypothetical protein
MDDTEIFDRFLKSRGLGERFPRSAMPEELWKKSYGFITYWAESLIASARELVPGLPPIHFDFVHNQNINAAAFKAEGRYFIAFNTGTRYMLELILFRMLSDSGLFDFVPSPAGEDSTLPPLKYTIRAEDMYQAGILPVPPKTKERRSYATMLLHRAFMFLIGHELAHITFGHVDYVLSKNGSAFIPELGWNLSTQEAILERQAIEAAADMRSVYSAIGSAQLLHEAPMPDEPTWIDTRRSVKDLLFDWSFAINATCRIFGDVEVEESDLLELSYPPWILRRFMAELYAGVAASGVWKPPETAVEIAKMLRAGSIYAEKAFLRVMNQEYGAKGLYQITKTPVGLEYFKKIHEYLTTTLSAKLEPFAYEKPFFFEEGL